MSLSQLSTFAFFKPWSESCGFFYAVLHHLVTFCFPSSFFRRPGPSYFPLDFFWNIAEILLAICYDVFNILMWPYHSGIPHSIDVVLSFYCGCHFTYFLVRYQLQQFHSAISTAGPFRETRVTSFSHFYLPMFLSQHALL